MKIIAVDDEKFALQDLQSAIEEALPGNELACFSSPFAALDYAKENMVNIAFIDVEMRGMNGLELAEKLTALYEKTNIIFTTGHPQYALDSFKVKASDFIAKPVTKRAILLSQKNLRYPIGTKRVSVMTFGGFEVLVDNKPLQFPRTRAKEVFAYLIYKRGTSCTVKNIAAVLMGDNRDGNLKIQADITTMKKVFSDSGVSDVIVKEFNSLAVNVEKIDCDYYRCLDGDKATMRLWTGEFMPDYEWAEHIAGYLERLIHG